MSKQENPYLRQMFIHGAPAAVLRVKREGSCLGQWMSGLETRAARNVVIVATANKLAWISRAVLSSGNDYRPMHRPFAVPARRSDLKNSLLGSLQKKGRTKPQSNDVPRTWVVTRAFVTVAIIKAGTCGSSSCPRRTTLHRGPIHFRRLLLVQPNSSCIRAADHTCPPTARSPVADLPTNRSLR